MKFGAERRVIVIGFGLTAAFFDFCSQHDTRIFIWSFSRTRRQRKVGEFQSGVSASSVNSPVDERESATKQYLKCAPVPPYCYVQELGLTLLDDE